MILNWLLQYHFLWILTRWFAFLFNRVSSSQIQGASVSKAQPTAEPTSLQIDAHGLQREGEFWLSKTKKAVYAHCNILGLLIFTEGKKNTTVVFRSWFLYLHDSSRKGRITVIQEYNKQVPWKHKPVFTLWFYYLLDVWLWRSYLMSLCSLSMHEVSRSTLLLVNYCGI